MLETFAFITDTLLSAELWEPNVSGINLSAGYQGVYPSESWGTKSWSYRLLLDFEKHRVISDFSGPCSAWLRSLARRFSGPDSSYHGDFNAKIRAFQSLKVRRPKKVIVPECGPCGFDILMAWVACQPEEIFAFDLNASFVECCRKIWANHSAVKIIQANTTKFDFSSYSDFVLIEPDWPHSKYSDIPLQRISYSSLDRAKKNKKSQEIDEFYRQFKAVGSPFV